VVPAELVPEVAGDAASDWSDLLDYDALLRHAEVRDRIALAAAQSTTAMTGEEFLQWCEKAFKPITEVSIPFAAIAKISQPLSASLGMKTGKERCELFMQPPGKVLVNVLCSLARQGRKLKQVHQIQEGCLLEADLGSDLFALSGSLAIIVRRDPRGTVVKATTCIPGQLFDWGKSARCLDQIMTDARRAA
jgi:hypothetical protein